MEYNFTAIEEQCKQFWDENKTYKINTDSDKPKYYILDMFPYPSGKGLHVGHPLGYIATDIYARYKALKGFNVLHPMGFDAYGLPAEQYAVKTGQHPAVTTKKNIETYTAQLRKLGFNYDWDRQVSTCEPNYYKWTQWIFLQLFESWYNNKTNKAEHIDTLIAAFEQNGNANIDAANNDEELSFSAAEWQAKTPKEKQDILMNYRLAYQSESMVNWCPALGTVLANDEVKDGLSEREGHPVERKPMRQWFLRITAYSQRLLDGLNALDWTESMKEMQRNWIGRSEGASVFFKIDGTELDFEIFTTRPDTIFGVTFMVLAPEHELVAQITSEEQKENVENYISYVKSRSDIERQAEKKVTGAFTGAYAIHPFTGWKIPIWISEYVLIGYGTGAIMAVPSDDDRDFAFANKFGIPVIDIIDKSKYAGATRHDKLGIMINSDFVNGMEVPDAIRAVTDRLEAENIGKGKINYRQRDAGYSRQRYWGEPFPIMYDKDGLITTVPENELPLELPEIESYKPSGTGESPIANNQEWVSLPNGGRRETDTMPGYAGSSWYFLRYMDPTNEEAFASKEALDYWQNVDYYAGGAEHAVGHLLYARFWYKFLYDRNFLTAPNDEPFQKLVNQGMIGGRSSFVYRIVSTNTYVSLNLKDNYETTALDLDISMVRNDVLDTEAFKKYSPEYADAEFILEDDKYICGYAYEKMSKRYLNVVNPDDIVASHGADCFRMYEMFLGPITDAKPWNTDSIGGVSKFLGKFWRLFKWNGEALNLSEKAADAKELKILHKTIKKVSEDIERLSFNTCVSAFMVCVNELTALKCDKKAVLEILVVLLAPFAPFTTEFLWQKMGHTTSVHHASFPAYDEKYLKEETKEYPVQINGKMRAKISLALDVKKEEVESIVFADANVQKWTEGKTIRKFIYVPNRIINIVAK